MKLQVLLGTSQEVSFDITLNDNSFTRKWVEELRWCLTNCGFNQSEAFADLNSIKKSADILVQSCKIINQYLKNFIEIKSDIIQQPQEYFNYLHSKFETLSGGFNEPTKLFSIADQELKTAIRNLNYYLHIVEEKKFDADAFYISFNKDQYRRKKLQIDDYDFFEFSFPPGTLYVHYVELGKEFVDLYEDQLSINYPGFKNLHYYSGEASLGFTEYDAFADKNYSIWLQNNGLDPYNKRLGHGKIPLGTVEHLQETISKIKEYRHLDKILIKE